MFKGLAKETVNRYTSTTMKVVYDFHTLCYIRHNKTSDAVTYLPPFENIIFWVEIFDKIALSLMVKENGRHFWKEENWAQYIA